MSYKSEISNLTQKIKNFESQLESQEKGSEQWMKLSNLISEYNAEIRRLNRLQWEEDTQRVNLDDR